MLSAYLFSKKSIAQKPDPNKPDALLKLPEEIEEVVSDYLDIKSAVNLAKTSKCHNAVQKEKLHEAGLVSCVTHGQVKKTQNLLQLLTDSKDTPQQLLSKKMNFTDNCKRQFKNITLFQYALWAMDSDMWFLLQNYLSLSQTLSQLKELQEKGVSYHTPSIKITGEKHFNLVVHINALEEYRRNIPHRNLSQLNPAWDAFINDAQKKFPACLIREYLDKHRSFDRTQSSWFMSDSIFTPPYPIRGHRSTIWLMHAQIWRTRLIHKVESDLQALKDIDRAKQAAIESLKEKLILYTSPYRL